MSERRFGRFGWFAGAAGAALAAGIGARLCPGTCTGCATCVGTALPMVSAGSMIGVAAIVGTLKQSRGADVPAKRGQSKNTA